MDFKKLVWAFAWLTTLVNLSKAQSPNCLRDTTLEPPALNFSSFMVTPAKPSHHCLRDCTGSAPMSCEYTFEVEWYYTMAKACYDCPCNPRDCERAQCVPADGVPRPIMVANRALPGPAIEVCEGDEVIVNTVNKMNNGESITIHWHGIYQTSNQYMDGVFMVTQCPILPGTTFRYNFTADHAGTHFWHAHTGMHRADGLFGAMIIRQSKQVDAQALLYDYDLPEHKVVLNDWTHQGHLSIYLDQHFRGTDDDPKSILINGKGAFAVYGNASTSTVTPREIYKVTQGKRYRFRVISSGIANVPMKVSVDDHKITLISSDGDDFEPLEVDAFFLYGGERYDFILNATQEVGNYWLKVEGSKQASDLVGLAVIRYQGAADEVPTADPSVDRQGLVYQDVNKTNVVPSANDLRSLVSRHATNNTMRRVYLPIGIRGINNPTFNDADLYPLGPSGPGWGEQTLPQINNRTFKFPGFSLLSQFDDERAAEGDYDQILCEVEQDGFENCDTEFCACTQYIKVDLGQTLEIVFIDEGTSPFPVNHPFHLHGQAFRILAQGRSETGSTKEDIIRLDENGGIVRNYDNPPEKDTVMTPNGGYTVVEFVAANPGWWIMHCHMEDHLEDGMGMLVRVGNQSDLPPVPEGFPRCGDYPAVDPTPPIPTTTPIPTAPPIPTSPPITLIILIVVIVLLAIIIIVLVFVIVCRRRSPDDGKGKHQQIPMNER